MSQKESRSDYWATFWSRDERLHNDNLHVQVGHTVNGTPIDQEGWQFTLDQIEKKIKLNGNDILLDLCAGNGLIAIPFSSKCRSVTAVDFARTLLNRIDTKLHPTITVHHADVRDVDLPENRFSKGVMYAALQHFSEREAIGVFSTIYRTLLPGGLFLIGDIPDVERLFAFYHKPEWERAYFESIKNNTPAVGTWYKKEMLEKMAGYTGFSKAETFDQSPRLLNSHYRFDLLLTK
jgi:ubiquinone/menaquinone biosynthesis C-methylase UbiE